MTPSATTAPAAPGWTTAKTMRRIALVVVAVQALLLATSNNAVLHGVLFDPDCYMYLTRALRLMHGQGWDGFNPHINAPYGYTIHWTSLFDSLLAAGAWPLVWLGRSPHDALYLWGSAISPLLLIGALWVFAAGVRPLVSGLAFLWLSVLVFTQPEFSGAFLAGRPDHHGLILGLTLVQLAWAIAALDGRAGARLALAAGVAAGLQLCTSVEALMTIVVVSAALALGWAVYRKPVLRLLAIYVGGCLAISMAFLAVTRGATFFVPAYDHISIVHGVVLAAGLGGVAILAMLDRTRLPRQAGLPLAGIGAGLVILLSFPDFFLGPWPHIDATMRAWLADVSELQPTLPTTPHRLAQFLAQFTAALLALPLTWRLLRHGNDNERMAMLVCLTGFCVFGALALAQMRWSGEMQAAMLLPWTLTTQRIMRSTMALRWKTLRLPLRSFALAAALLLQIGPGALAPARALPPQTTTATGCNWSTAAYALAGATPQRGIVMAELWYGPEILWRTDLDVVGGPYGIPPALIDSYRFASGELAAERDVLTRRGVSYVVNCGALPHADALGLKPMPFAAPGFALYQVTR